MRCGRVFESNHNFYTYNRTRQSFPQNTFTAEFTSEYGIPDGLHLELPGPEETIMDFPKSKVANHQKKHPTVLCKTPGLLEKLEQSIFMGGREDISHCRGLAHKRSEGWDASSELVLHGGRDIIGHTPYPHPKTTRSPVIPSRAEPEILSGGRSCPESHQSKDRDPSSDTVHHREVAARLCQRRPTPNNYRGGGAEDQVQDAVACETPLTGNASATGVALETGLEKKVAAMGPPVNKRCCQRGNNEAKANAPPKVLRRDYDAFRPWYGYLSKRTK
nr:hypothetical protein [Tanacetum cinerariifolium]